MATVTCTNLQTQLQKRVSKAKPPFKKNSVTNKTTDIASDKCIVLDKELKILIMDVT